MPLHNLGSRVASLYEVQSAWLEPKLQSIGVRWTTFQLLATIMGAGQDASQAEVARRLGVAPATLSESVQLHVKDNLLQQVPSKKDKRKKILELTPKGIQLMMQIRGFVQECEKVMTAGLSGQEAALCAKVIDQMAENLEKALET